ncbi:unnamed protein product [Auanema sp. JU1783]|nr:unnamed protein product [Auanema sp. JU1783]
MDSSHIEICSVSESLLNSSGSTGSMGSSPSHFSRSSSDSLIKYRKPKFSEKYQWIPLSVASILIVLLSLLMMIMMLFILQLKQEAAYCRQENDENAYHKLFYENTEKLEVSSDQLRNLFDANRIRRNLKWMSRNNHIAGLSDNTILMKRIADEYERLGLDVRIHNYTVLLNYPDFNHPNTVEILDEDDRWFTISHGYGLKLGPAQASKEQSDPRSTLWWNAYSGNGSVESTIVYCNYGMPEDYKDLQKWGINVTDSIALIRYGGISRSEKVKEAKRNGVAAIILYSDPIHYTNRNSNKTFPDDIYLPGTDAQRGSVLSTHGDPLTPMFPSLPYVLRTESQESLTVKGYLNVLPVTPIGYDDAERLMHLLDGPLVHKSEWKGGLTVHYRLTGSKKFRVNVRSRNAKRVVSNVIATLKGKEEPDRWILVGNHVDAWGSGAIDPLSGTATQLEMARVASTLYGKEAPRRTIVFCHWDAEEFGLIGSTEWIEEMQAVLSDRAVAYINVDHIAGNTTLDVKAVPLLYRLIVDSAAKIPQLNEDEKLQKRSTLLDSWLYYRNKSPFPGDRSMPDIGLPGSGSDYQRFITFAGVASADLKMESIPGMSYALYHTMYETFWTVQNLMDPNFSSMLSIGQLWMEIVHQLSNRLVIPFHPLHFAQSLTSIFHKAETQISHMNVSQHIPKYYEKVTGVKHALRRLMNVATVFQLEVQEISSGLTTTSISRVDQLNRRLILLERAMLDSHAFRQPIYKHLLYSPSRYPSQVSCLASILDPCLEFLENERNSIETLNDHSSILGWLPIPAKYACWAELILIEFVTPNSSFVGHFSGILTGLLYTYGPLRETVAILRNIVGESSHRHRPEPSAPPQEDDDPTYRSYRTRGGTSTRDSIYREYTGGLSEEEQLRRAYEESLKDANPSRRYGWNI